MPSAGIGDNRALVHSFWGHRPTLGQSTALWNGQGRKAKQDQHPSPAVDPTIGGGMGSRQRCDLRQTVIIDPGDLERSCGRRVDVRRVRAVQATFVLGINAHSGKSRPLSA